MSVLPPPEAYNRRCHSSRSNSDLPYLFVNPPPNHLIWNLSRIAIIDVFINTLFLMLDATLCHVARQGI